MSPSHNNSYNWSSYDPRIRRRSWIAVLLVQLLLVLVLFYFGFVTPLPLPGEEGVTVSFGTEQGGQNLTWQETSVPPVQNYVPEPVREVEEKPLTQDFEDAPEVRTPEHPKTPKKEESKPKKENPKPVVQQPTPQQPQQTVVKEPEPPQPQVNQQALFPGRTPEAQQGGAGTGGQAGNQGMPDGQATTPSLGQGSGAGTGSGHGQGTGGGGIGYSVGNRKALKLPPPEYPGQKNGKVVVKVWVNKEGKVVKAEAGEKGSTLYDKTFLSASENAALQAHFDVAADAPEMQVGTITYVFRLKQ